MIIINQEEDQCSTNDYEQTVSLFPAGRIFLPEYSLALNEKSPMEWRKINFKHKGFGA